jgi:MATE family multidrug resistance protein
VQQEETLAALLRLARPIIVSRLAIMMMGLCDVIVVGQYAAEELAYQSLGWAPTGVVLVTAIGLLLGVQILTARHIGEGRKALAGAVWRRGLVYGFWLGLAGGAIVFLSAEPFLRLAGMDESLARGAGAVARVLALSLPFHLVYIATSFFLEGVNRPMPAMVAMLLANVLNLGLNLALVFGFGPIPAMGAVGSAWATLGARLALAGGLVWFVWTMRDAAAYAVRARPRPDRALSREQRRVGYAAGLSQAFEAGAFSMMNVIAGMVSALQVAAFAVGLNVLSIVFMIALGFSSATGVLVSQARGRGDLGGMSQAAWLGLGATALAMLLPAALFLAAPQLVARAYVSDPVLLGVVTPLLILCAFVFVADGAQVVVAQALRSIGDVWFPTVSHFVSYALVMLPLGYLACVTWGRGAQGAMFAIIAASLLSALILTGRLWLRLRPSAGPPAGLAPGSSPGSSPGSASAHEGAPATRPQQLADPGGIC